jgi:hypothetical protein
VEASGFAEKHGGALRIVLRESKQLSTALRGNDTSKQEKSEKFLPGKVRGRA